MLSSISYLHVFVSLHRIHQLEWLESLLLLVLQLPPFELVHMILLVVAEPVYSMRTPALVVVDTLEMLLVALASSEHSHNENLVERLDNLDNVAVVPHIHFGNLALVELEVFAMYDFPGLLNALWMIDLWMCCYVDFCNGHSLYSDFSVHSDFGHHDMGTVNVCVDYSDCKSHVEDHDC